MKKFAQTGFDNPKDESEYWVWYGMLQAYNELLKFINPLKYKSLVIKHDSTPDKPDPNP